MTTKRQKAAEQFCEEWEFPKFNGDINNFKQVSTYLSRYLELAKIRAMELTCEYDCYLNDLND